MMILQTFILSSILTVAMALPAYIGRLNVSALITSITSLKEKKKKRRDERLHEKTSDQIIKIKRVSMINNFLHT